MHKRVFILLLALFVGTPAFAAQLSPAPTLPPAPPIPTAFQSPVQFFRDLLAMSKVERAKALASRSERSRTALHAKIQEYESMKPELRELKLRTTELRWYLKTLLPMEQAQRTAKLKLVSPPDRQLVTVRLKQWDLLSPGWRDEVLKHERTMDWLRRKAMNPSSGSTSSATNPDLARWQSLPKETQSGMFASFDRFFQLSETERRRTLASVPAPRRAIVAPAIRKLSALPPAKREECLDAFRKLTAMPATQQQHFFRKADQWRQMTRSERETWANLVNKFPPMPPLPPGLVIPGQSPEAARIVQPPLPPGLDLPTMPPMPFLTKR